MIRRPIMIMVSLWWCNFTLPPPITHWTTRRSLSIVDWPAGKGPSSWWSTLFKMIDCLRNVTFVHFLTALAALFLPLFWDMENILRTNCDWVDRASVDVLPFSRSCQLKVCPHGKPVHTLIFQMFQIFQIRKKEKEQKIWWRWLPLQYWLAWLGRSWQCSWIGGNHERI